MMARMPSSSVTGIVCFEAAAWISREQWHPEQQGRWLADGCYELRLPYADDLGGLRLQFDGFDPDASYIVKLTPVLDAGQERANGVPMLFCSGFFAPKPRVPGGVGVVIRSPGDDIFQTVRFMVEISQFTPDELG